MEDNAGLIIVTEETPNAAAITELVMSFCAYRLTANKGETISIEFNRHPANIPENYPQEIIVTHRTIDPLMKMRNAFRAAWARLNANQCLVAKFEVRPIYDPKE